MELANQIELQVIENATAAGFGDTLESATIDLEGWDGCLVIYMLGAIDATGVPTLTIKDSPDDSTYTAVSGASQAGTATSDNKIVGINFNKPTQRYLKADLQRETANIALSVAVAIKYSGLKKPVTQGATVEAILKVIGGNV